MDRVLILDFGSQVTQLIARRIRNKGVYCEIHPFNKIDEIDQQNYEIDEQIVDQFKFDQQIDQQF